MLNLVISRDSSRDFPSVHREFFLIQRLFSVQRDMETMDEWICDQDTLGYDEACINLRTEDSNAWLYLLSADCALVSHARTRSFYVFSCFAYFCLVQYRFLRIFQERVQPWLFKFDVKELFLEQLDCTWLYIYKLKYMENIFSKLIIIIFTEWKKSVLGFYFSNCAQQNMNLHKNPLFSNIFFTIQTKKLTLNVSTLNCEYQLATTIYSHYTSTCKFLTLYRPMFY